MPSCGDPPSANATELARLERMFRQAPGFRAMLEGPEHCFAFCNPAFLRIIGDRDVIGRPVAEVMPDAVAQGYVALLDRVFATGKAFDAKSARFVVVAAPDEEGDERFLDFVYQPILDEAGCVTGIYVDGADVTDRVRAETALRDNEARFRLMVDAVPQIVWITDRHGRMEFLNRQFTDYAGIDVEGRTADEIAAHLIHADDAPAVVRAFDHALATGEPFEVEHRIRSAAGIDRWFLARAQPERDPATGAVLRWFGASVDIDDRKQAEARLVLSRELLRLATDIGEIGEWHVDNLTGTMFWPPRVKAMFGLPAEAAVTLDDFYHGVHPDDRDAVRAAYDAANDPERRALYDVEYRTIGRDDGRIRWIAAKGRGLFDDHGTCIRVLGTAIDITARKADELRLRDLNERLEQEVRERTAERNRVWELSRELLAIVRFDGGLKAINPAWATTLGYDLAAPPAPPSRDQIHPDDRDAVRAMMARLRAGETVERFESRARHADGHWRWISWTLVPEGPEFYAVGRDVTAEREAAAELEQAQVALRQSQKMEAMGSLTGGVAHDFNNLLTPIVGSLDLLQRRGTGGDREQRLIAGAIQAADRAKTLVQRLLAFARRQPLQPMPVDVGALAHGMADLLGSTTGPQVRVVVEVADDLPPARADPNQLEMALLNLGVNARDAMPDGGTLRITATRETVPAARGELKRGHYVRLSVADTGTGMDAATLARAVEPFFSTKGIGKGTGLGLSMAHGLAAQLGGALTIQSRPGLGTNIELWLPISATLAGDRTVDDAPAATGQADGLVLLVDDEEVVRMSTADMLEDMGYAVRHAASAEAALALVERGLVPDLLVTDHLMPGMNGVDLARALRDRFAALPVLIVSGYAEAEGIAPDLPRLTKPFRSADLEACLASLHVGGLTLDGVGERG